MKQGSPENIYSYHSFLLSLEADKDKAGLGKRRSKDLIKRISKFCKKKSLDEGNSWKVSEKQILKYGAQKVLEVVKRHPHSVSEIVDAIFEESKGSSKALTKKELEWGNIQRRIYDIINVLVAAGCVERLEDKRIAYKGFAYVSTLEHESKTEKDRERADIIKEKAAILEKKQKYLKALMKLIEKNKRMEKCGFVEKQKIPLPFVAVKIADGDQTVSMRWNEGATQLEIDSANPIEIKGSEEVLCGIFAPRDK